jgi:hypothetical protein
MVYPGVSGRVGAVSRQGHTHESEHERYRDEQHRPPNSDSFQLRSSSDGEIEWYPPPSS